MITGYTKPQLLIRQQMAVVTNTVARSLHACSVGPQFDLHRYTNPSERLAMAGTLFAENASTDPANRQVVPYEGNVVTNIIDEVYTKLYAENLEGQIFTANSATSTDSTEPYLIKLTDVDRPNRLKLVHAGAVLTLTAGVSGQLLSAAITHAGAGYPKFKTIDYQVTDGGGADGWVRLTTNGSGAVSAVSVISPGSGYNNGAVIRANGACAEINVGSGAESDLLAALHGRPIQAGDVLYATLDGVTSRRTVRGVERALQAASFGGNADGTNKRFAASELNPAETASAALSNLSAPANWALVPAHGSLLEVAIAAGGSGYTDTPGVTVSAPISIDSGGLSIAGVQATAEAVAVGGQVTDISVTNPGVGYYVGGLVGVTIVSKGANYSQSLPPVITFPTPSGGVAARVQVVVGSDKKVSGIKILDPGYGYTTHVGNSGAYVTDGFSINHNGGSGLALIFIANLGSVRSATIGAALADRTALNQASWTAATDAAGSSKYKANIYVGGASAAPTSGHEGTGYAVGDLITVGGGTALDGNAAVFRVLTVSAGAIATLELVNMGEYSGTLPGSTGTNKRTACSTTGGSGTGAQLDVVFKVSSIKIVDPYTGLTGTPTCSYSGGDSGQEAYITNAALTVDLVSPFQVALSDAGSGASLTPISLSHATDWSGLEAGSSYQGKYAEWYSIKVTRGSTNGLGGTVQIRSASGQFFAASVAVARYGLNYLVDSAQLGGLKVMLATNSPSTELHAGDVFAFTVTGKYLPLALDNAGFVRAVDILAAGSGYTNGTYLLTAAAPPTGGTPCVVSVTVSGNAVASVTLLQPGAGYVVPPLLHLVGAGAGTGAAFVATLAQPEDNCDIALVQSGGYAGQLPTQYRVKVVKGVDNGDVDNSFTGAVVQISDTAGLDVLKEITVEHNTEYDLGSLGLRVIFPNNLPSPSGDSGSVLATGTVHATGGVIDYVTITNGGSGYAKAPVVTFGGDGTNATGVAVVYKGRVIGVNITNGGTGYTSPTLTFSAPVQYQGGLRKGDLYYVNAKPMANTGAFDTIVLSGQVVDTAGWLDSEIDTNLFDLDVRVLFNGVVPQKQDDAPNFAWTPGTTADGGILVKNALKVFVPERDEDYQWVPAKASTAGRLYAHYRALVPATSSQGFARFVDENAITARFGLDDDDNPACRGALITFRGGQGKAIYAASLATNDLAGHMALIRQAEHIDGIYSIAIMNADTASIRNAWKAHVQKMSLENLKLWRRAYIGTQNPGPYAALDVQEDGSDYMATIAHTAAGNVRVVSADANFKTNGVKSGDLFRTNYRLDEWGVASFDEYVIYSVNEEDELTLVSGPANPVSPAAKFEIWRPDSGEAQAMFVGQQSQLYSDRRFVNVWGDAPMLADATGDLTVRSPQYLAAEIAGLRAAVLPQQGLTLTELQYSVQALPKMYTKYTDDELNLAAQRGTFIVTQDSEDGPCYIRHQLTTDTNHGIMYYEDSVGTNLDAIAYAFKDAYAPYVGKRNANLEVLEELQTKGRAILDAFKQSPANSLSPIGPALINYTNFSVTLDSTYKDRVNVTATLELPMPLNTIVVTLNATVASDATVTTINFTVNQPTALAA